MDNLKRNEALVFGCVWLASLRGTRHASQAEIVVRAKTKGFSKRQTNALITAIHNKGWIHYPVPGGTIEVSQSAIESKMTSP